ncbi:MerR family transcriptional regulator [Ornithinibacillus scapharcae]|uniref:MerR family transcriptional regulator n=1 Tax=Ornithinibacillus scapharcae TaxID=1147159 RepID=UPI000225B677|nr:MerR family transcriptional regulator [Ornithinibacillus scapharcae]
MMMSIDTFSKKTGLSKSALRFYEEKGLLIPGRNEENGYRLYLEEQVDLARFINSLRLANVPLTEIKSYLSASEVKQRKIKQGWITSLEQQRDILDVQIKYIKSSIEDERIFLMEMKEERVLWVYAEGKQGGFSQYFIKGKEELEKQQISVQHFYLQYVSGRETVKAWIGFGVGQLDANTNITFFDKEESIRKSLCVATVFRGDFFKIEKAYQRLINYMSDNQYIPTGPLLERYSGNELNSATIVIPVMKWS